jgi:hypothetical protein
MNRFIYSLAASSLLLSISVAQAEDDNSDDDIFHAPPFNYLFGNHIDTHQENKLKLNRDGSPRSLKGNFYIIPVDEDGDGNTDIDPVSGLEVWRHPRGLELDESGNVKHDERCGVTVTCTTGWEMKGLPGNAKLLSHDGVNGDDHPVWMVNRAEEASAPTTDMLMPQPGSYLHFHWITSTSTDPRASTVPVGSACDKQKAGQLEDKAPTAVNEVCPGWFLQIEAGKKFAFKHGGELIPIVNGIDNRSHLNLVTNYRSPTVVPITKSRD